MIDPAELARVLSMPIVEHRPGLEPGLAMPASRGAVLVFGHQLESDGSLRPRLVQRLEVARHLAERFPSVPLVLTGGRLGAPISEAEAMYDWLVAEGVDPDRLHVEPLAEDTLGNALHSLPILAGLDVTHATLVTTTYHVRRSLLLLAALATRYSFAIGFDHLAAIDPALPASMALLSEAERAVIDADLERAQAIPLVSR